MSLMVVEVYDAFRAANVDEKLARAAAKAVVGREDLATKRDLERAFGRVRAGRFDAGLKSEIDRFDAGLKSEIGRFGTDAKSEIGRFGVEVESEIGRFGTDVKSEIDRFGAEVRAEFRGLRGDVKLLTYGYAPVVTGLLIKLVFFP